MSFSQDRANVGGVYDSGSAFTSQLAQAFDTGVYEQVLKSIEYPKMIPTGRMIYNTNLENMDEVLKMGVVTKGNAQITTMYDSQDAPRLTLDYMQLKTRNFKGEISFLMNSAKQSVLTAGFAKNNIAYNHMQASIRGCNYQLEKVGDLIFLIGDQDLEIEGLLSSSAVTTVIASTGGSGSTLFENKTPSEIISDFITAMSNVQLISNNERIPTKVYLPISADRALDNLVSTAGSRSIRSYLIETFSGSGFTFEIQPTTYLATKALFIDERNDDDIKFIRPLMVSPYQPTELTKNNMHYEYQTQFCAPLFHNSTGILYLDGVANDN